MNFKFDRFDRAAYFTRWPRILLAAKERKLHVWVGKLLLNGYVSGLKTKIDTD
jgi:hypothetical protein